jgi:hypothetical protein
MFALSPRLECFQETGSAPWNPTFHVGGQAKDPAISLATWKHCDPCNKSSTCLSDYVE